MLQEVLAELKPARRLNPRIPVSAHWNHGRSNPAIYFAAVTDFTGGCERKSEPFVFYDRALESLAQTIYKGTGGEALWTETMQNWASASGAYIVVQNPPWAAGPSVNSAAVMPLDVGRQLAFARHYLSLNTTDLSKILLVERPTVYAWLDGKWDPKQENKGRIRKLYQIACTWHETSKHPVGKLLREPVYGDLSLMDYLLRDTFEMAAINRVLEVIRELNDRKIKTKRARSVREIVKQRRFKPLSSTQEDERFDQITKF